MNNQDTFDFYQGLLCFIQDNELKKWVNAGLSIKDINNSFNAFLNQNKDIIVLSWNIFKKDYPILTDVYFEIYKEFERNQTIKDELLEKKVI